MCIWKTIVIITVICNHIGSVSREWRTMVKFICINKNILLNPFMKYDVLPTKSIFIMTYYSEIGSISREIIIIYITTLILYFLLLDTFITDSPITSQAIDPLFNWRNILCKTWSCAHSICEIWMKQKEMVDCKNKRIMLSFLFLIKIRK